jgi:hypothetical protein
MKAILVAALGTMCMAFAQDRTLTVLVLDYAGLSGSSLNEMESLSGLLLSRTGIRTQWVHCFGHQAGPPERWRGSAVLLRATQKPSSIQMLLLVTLASIAK